MTKPPQECLPDVHLPVCPEHRLLEGQKALVTGASSGIGRIVALALGRAGADLVINHLDDRETADELAGQIRDAGRTALVHQADVSREDQVRAMFRHAADELGTVDILVNNAGIQRDAPFHEMTLEQWNQVIAVNLTGQFLCAREAVREFLRRGVRPEVSCAAGKIICISSVHELIPWAGHVNYSASKGGVELMMKSVAQEVAPFRIRVNSICPGAIRTPINQDVWSDPEKLEKLLELVPYHRIGEPEDVARLAVWLASDESDYVVGQSLFIDGGMTLYPGFADNG